MRERKRERERERERGRERKKITSGTHQEGESYQFGDSGSLGPIQPLFGEIQSIDRQKRPIGEKRPTLKKADIERP